MSRFSVVLGVSDLSISVVPLFFHYKLSLVFLTQKVSRDVLIFLATQKNLEKPQSIKRGPTDWRLLCIRLLIPTILQASDIIFPSIYKNLVFYYGTPQYFYGIFYMQQMNNTYTYALAHLYQNSRNGLIEKHPRLASLTEKP